MVLIIFFICSPSRQMPVLAQALGSILTDTRVRERVRKTISELEGVEGVHENFVFRLRN